MIAPVIARSELGASLNMVNCAIVLRALNGPISGNDVARFIHAVILLSAFYYATALAKNTGRFWKV